MFQNGDKVDEYNAATHVNAAIYSLMRETMLANDTVVLPESAPGTETGSGANAETGLLCPAATVILLAFLVLSGLGARRRGRC